MLQFSAPAAGGACVFYLVDDASSFWQISGNGSITAAATLASFGVGPFAAAGAGGLSGLSLAVPRRFRVVVAAQGAGVVTSLVIHGR
jgi:hypothetical protein